MEDVIREAKDGPEYLFISFDIDALDPAFVSATGTPEPGGLTPREAVEVSVENATKVWTHSWLLDRGLAR